MSRSIDSLFQADQVIDDGDLRRYRALPSEQRSSIGPFVFLDHYKHRTLRGIGDKPHPHAGIELISYLLEGGMEHRDSQGFRDRLGPGDAQWMRAGKGILHAEQPLGGREGLQLWASLPPAQRFSNPAYRSWRATELPVAEFSGGRVHVIAGRVAEAEGPVQLATSATLAHVHLDSSGSVEFLVGADAELAAYIVGGAVSIRGEGRLCSGSIVMLTSGSQISLTNLTDTPADVIVLGGHPVKWPILFSGSFVMSTQEELLRAKRDYASGAMGRLEGVPF